ncbi:MAG: (2Fe-2S) ferredoxin domain-containing protein [Elusimicrobia bacterium]|nr:(2Fe-2S) ferredoxin domain-containing protein [Elusimicrobiota bacterium]
MEKKIIPYRKTIFVCTNKRDDGRSACANPGRGGDEIYEALKREVKKAGLKGQVRVVRSGCLDLCERGPNLFIYPSGEWRCSASIEDIPELLKEML